MALTFVAATSAATAGAAQTLACNIPVGTAAGDTVYAVVALSAASTVQIMAPVGWGEHPVYAIYNGNYRPAFGMRLYIRKAKAGESGVAQTFVFESAQQVAIVMATYRGGRGAGLVGNSGVGAPYTVSYSATNIANGFKYSVIAMNNSGDTWTAATNYTSQAQASTVGANGVTIMWADDPYTTVESGGSATHTCTSSAQWVSFDGMLYPDGITQATGYDGDIVLYDDSKAWAVDGSATLFGYDMGDLIRACPYNIRLIGDYSQEIAHLATANIKIGSSAGSASTSLTLLDKDLIFKTGKTLSFETTNRSSWTFRSGDKRGTGTDIAGVRGGNMRFGAITAFNANSYVYGSTVFGSNQVAVAPMAGSTAEWAACLISPNGNVIFGSTTTPVTTFSNSLVSANAASGMTSWDVTNSENITIIVGPSTQTRMFGTGAGLKLNKIRFIGDPVYGPGLAVWRTSPNYGASGTGFIRGCTFPYQVVNGTIPIFDPASGLTAYFGLQYATCGYRQLNTLVVDGLGNPLSGIPVKLIDAYGNVQVNTTTGVDGNITFGQPLWTQGQPLVGNYVVMFDWYETGSPAAWKFRRRDPFTLQFNMGTGSNSAYPGRQMKFTWPAEDLVSHENQRDLTVIMPLSEPSSATTNWLECSIP